MRAAGARVVNAHIAQLRSQRVHGCEVGGGLVGLVRALGGGVSLNRLAIDKCRGDTGVPPLVEHNIAMLRLNAKVALVVHVTDKLSAALLTEGPPSDVCRDGISKAEGEDMGRLCPVLNIPSLSLSERRAIHISAGACKPPEQFKFSAKVGNGRIPFGIPINESCCLLGAFVGSRHGKDTIIVNEPQSKTKLSSYRALYTVDLGY